jgi:spore maturation protein A
MINIIWGIFVVSGILYYLISGDISSINSEILNSGKVSLDMVIEMFPVMAVWLGLMNIAKESGLLQRISSKVSIVLKYLFPDIPKGHESISYIASNIVINMFGLGSAATPFGLKAMKSLQKLNTKKDTASRSMITFLVLNTSGVTIVPTMIISIRMMHGSINPTEIVITCLIATICSTIAGLLMDRFLARRYS